MRLLTVLLLLCSPALAQIEIPADPNIPQPTAGSGVLAGYMITPTVLRVSPFLDYRSVYVTADIGDTINDQGVMIENVIMRVGHYVHFHSDSAGARGDTLGSSMDVQFYAGGGSETAWIFEVGTEVADNPDSLIDATLSAHISEAEAYRIAQAPPE